MKKNNSRKTNFYLFKTTENKLEIKWNLPKCK